jgi:hypothetical protein
MGDYATRLRSGEESPAGRRQAISAYVTNVLNYNKYTYMDVYFDGFLALLGAQVIGAWTALDTLTSDLWAAAVNVEPGVLYNMQKKKILVKHLLESGRFDWTNKLGDLLRNRIRFDSFSVTKQVYKRTFKSSPAIFKPLESDELAVACLVRNNLVHNAGKATDKFVELAGKKGLAPWNTVKMGQKLPLDGLNAAAIAESIVTCANELIRAVDDWLPSPAPKSPAPTR